MEPGNARRCRDRRGAGGPTEVQVLSFVGPHGAGEGTQIRELVRPKLMLAPLECAFHVHRPAVGCIGRPIGCVVAREGHRQRQPRRDRRWELELHGDRLLLGEARGEGIAHRGRVIVRDEHVKVWHRELELGLPCGPGEGGLREREAHLERRRGRRRIPGVRGGHGAAHPVVFGHLLQDGRQAIRRNLAERLAQGDLGVPAERVVHRGGEPPQLVERPVHLGVLERGEWRLRGRARKRGLTIERHHQRALVAQRGEQESEGGVGRGGIDP